MPRAQKEADKPKTDKAKWTDSKVRFVLNEFISEKEGGNMNSVNWKPIAFTNVTKKYNLAYPEAPMLKRQIKNLYTGKKGVYSRAQRLKNNTGIGWVEGECRIDMPKEWWDSVGEKDKDAGRFRNQTFIFYDQMDEILHQSKPSGALRTGTSSSDRVKAKKPEDEEESDENDEDKENEEKKENEDKDDNAPRDRQGLTAAERALDSSSQKEDDELPVIDDLETGTSKSKKGKEKKKETKPVVHVDLSDSDVDDKRSTSRKKQPGFKSNIKKKIAACPVKPGTLANAIASASKDSIEKAKNLAQRDGIKATASADCNQSIEEAARIKAEKHPHQRAAIVIFNEKSISHFPVSKDCIMALNALKEEAEASIFELADEETRWEWLKEEVLEKKKAQGG